MSVKYILDTNVYIEAYKGYYHPDIVPVYWDILKNLGEKNIVKSPIQVRDEIKIQNKPSASKEPPKDEDRFLYDWARSSENNCFLKQDLLGIENHFSKVQDAYLIVKRKNTDALLKKDRDFKWPRREPVSDQDMFVIATVLFYQEHFPNTKFVLVTKEGNDNPPKSYKPGKIPHICNEMGIQWMTDFDFIKKVGITFDTSWFLNSIK